MQKELGNIYAMCFKSVPNVVTLTALWVIVFALKPNFPGLQTSRRVFLDLGRVFAAFAKSLPAGGREVGRL